MRPRDCNLDLLRAIAIVIVLVYHVAIMWPTDDLSPMMPFTGLGKYGVTLFFVLSGWLIGGIYWREHRAAGHVRVGNFWLRRWLRTVPPYLVGVALAYCDVLYGRGDLLDYRYLFFLQNYEEPIPFYLISWSLCVEEHFYLLLPFVGALCGKLPVKWATIAVWSLPLISPLLRALDPSVDPQAPFGYSHTATHLISEGLALGVAAAFTRCYYPQRWASLQHYARYLAVPALIAFLSVAWWDFKSEFYIGQSMIAVCSLVWLAACVERASPPWASSKVVYAIAVTSYSVYLTHSLAIQVAGRIALPNGNWISDTLALVCWLGIIAVAGRTFYIFVERPAIQFRDHASRWMTARGRQTQNIPPAATASAVIAEPDCAART